MWVSHGADGNPVYRFRRHSVSNPGASPYSEMCRHSGFSRYDSESDSERWDDWYTAGYDSEYDIRDESLFVNSSPERVD